jgi:hypothetical protein
MKVTTWVLFVVAVLLVAVTYYRHQEWEHAAAVKRISPKSIDQGAKTK